MQRQHYMSINKEIGEECPYAYFASNTVFGNRVCMSC